jgi:hypothetical protein
LFNLRHRMTAIAPATSKTRISLPSIVIVGLFVIAIVYERWQGRVWWCQLGDWWPISLNINSPHNSQHLLDPYSFSHVLHGILFYGFFWLFRRKMNMPWRLVAATAIEIAWEMLENSPIIIDRYRAATISLGYTGDSIANSMGDVLCCILGYYIARAVGLWWSIAIIVVVELGLLWWIRDNLTLNILMLIHPIASVRHWQAG